MEEQAKKIAAVTGSARGIGRAIAEKLAGEGVDVAILDVNVEGAQATAAEIAAKYGVRTWSQRLDVSDSEAVNAVFKECEEQLGTVNILVNNAGVTRDGLFLRMKDDQWNTVIAIHLNGTAFCTRAALRGMVKQRYGRIINISSIIGLRGQAGQANYAAAKAGIIGFTKAIAHETASRGITVNAIAPGYIATEMTAQLKPEILEQFIKMIPMGRQGSVDDIANTVRFLASDDAAYITGVTLSVDGGMAM